MISDERLNNVIETWIKAQDAGDINEHDENWWAVEEVLNWHLHDESEHLWQFIINLYTIDVSPRVFSALAAGPLEDLLSDFGKDYIDRVEELAANDDKFNLLLGGVWRLGMTDEIWERVCKARREIC